MEKEDEIGSLDQHNKKLKTFFTKKNENNSEIADAFYKLERWKNKPLKFVKYKNYVVKGYLIKEA